MKSTVITPSKIKKSKLTEAIRELRTMCGHPRTMESNYTLPSDHKIGCKLYENGGIESYFNGEVVRQVTPCEGDVLVDLAFSSYQNPHNNRIIDVLIYRYNEKIEALYA